MNDDEQSIRPQDVPDQAYRSVATWEDTLPSQIELATLAASLPNGDATERVNLAMRIWRESHPERVAFRDMVENEESCREPLGVLMPISEMLAELMPSASEETKEANWASFRDWQHQKGEHLESTVETDKKNGVALYINLSSEFSQWQRDNAKVKAKRRNTNRAGKGGAKRWARNRAEKAFAGEKTQTRETLIRNLMKIPTINSKGRKQAREVIETCLRADIIKEVKPKFYLLCDDVKPTNPVKRRKNG